MAWKMFPYPDDAYVYTAPALKKAWARLHVGDAEPYPKKAVLVDAWIAFHAGDFEKAVSLGLDVGVEGYSVAHKASCIYATYLESNDKRRLAMFEEVAERCERHQAERPDTAAAYYWHAYALGRYAQGISIVKALAQGIAPKVRASLDKAVKLAPTHADAHVALGAFHTEILGSVGSMIGALTYGCRKEEAYREFRTALELNPDAAVGRIEFGNALVTLEGKKKMDEALALFRAAAAVVPQDAMERFDVEAAKAELEGE
jgi:tetratricopeptide (TPR) repeat protein